MYVNDRIMVRVNVQCMYTHAAQNCGVGVHISINFPCARTWPCIRGGGVEWVFTTGHTYILSFTVLVFFSKCTFQAGLFNFLFCCFYYLASSTTR